MIDKNAAPDSSDNPSVMYELERREETNIFTCDWDDDPNTQTCWLGDGPGPY